MVAYRHKLIIFILLSIAFLSYSVMLYVVVPEEKQPAGPLAKQGITVLPVINYMV